MLYSLKIFEFVFQCEVFLLLLYKNEWIFWISIKFVCLFLKFSRLIQQTYQTQFLHSCSLHSSQQQFFRSPNKILAYHIFIQKLTMFPSVHDRLSPYSFFFIVLKKSEGTKYIYPHINSSSVTTWPDLRHHTGRVLAFFDLFFSCRLKFFLSVSSKRMKFQIISNLSRGSNMTISKFKFKFAPCFFNLHFLLVIRHKHTRTTTLLPKSLISSSWTNSFLEFSHIIRSNK